MKQSSEADSQSLNNRHQQPASKKGNQVIVINNDGIPNALQANQKLAHSINNSQSKKKGNEYPTNVQNSIENLHDNDMVDNTRKAAHSFNNTQGLNLQQILLETDQQFPAQKGKKQAIQSSKKLNQTTYLNTTQLRHQELLKAQIEANQKSIGPKNMMGPYIIQTNKQNAHPVAPGIPNMKMLANQLGSSSATNKAKKAFNFEIDVQQKMKQKGKGASAVTYSNKSK